MGLIRPLFVAPKPTTVEGAWFDQSAVDKVVEQCRHLRHIKGEWAGQVLELDEWQIQWIIAPVFGWKHPDGRRIRRTAFVDVPRKNAKSTLAAALGLIMTAGDGEPGAEVYAAAGDKDQARAVFDVAKKMAEGAHPDLRKRLVPMRSQIEAPRFNSVFKVVSSDARLKHGFNVHFAVIDEVHVHRDADLIDALETGTASRRQPLILFITTADDGDEFSIYGEKRAYVENVANGVVDDPTFYGVVFAAEESDPWDDPKTWKKANPGYGTSVKPDYLHKEATKAANSRRYLPTFKRLHLGIRSKSATAWFSADEWDANAGDEIDLKELAGRECLGGLDLSTTTDLTAFELFFPDRDNPETPEHLLVSFFWLPEDNVAALEDATKVPLQQWVTEGWIVATEGNVVDYAAVEARITELSELFDIRSIGYDPWSAAQMVQNLESAGLDMVPIRQGFASLSAPSKTFETLILRKDVSVNHGGNPVLRWMATVVEVRTDANDNIRPVRPDRRKSGKRVDGIVAGVMAIDRFTRTPAKKKRRSAGF